MVEDVTRMLELQQGSTAKTSRRGQGGEEPTEAAEKETSQLSAVLSTNVDRRFVSIWCTFLGQLARDAAAAHAAAMAYRDLDAAARDVWIGALEQDVPRIGVPRIAVYAPLLAVETDPARRIRISQAIGQIEPEVARRDTSRALVGIRPDGLRVAALVTPLYLDFVRVLACGYRPGDRFEWVKHDPIAEDRQAPLAGDTIDDAALERAPIKCVIDELALTVVAHNRQGRPVPEALCLFADLFGPSAVTPETLDPDDR